MVILYFWGRYCLVDPDVGLVLPKLLAGPVFLALLRLATSLDVGGMRDRSHHRR